MNEPEMAADTPPADYTASNATYGSMPARPPLRLLVPTLVLVVFWIVTEGSYRLEMGMFYRFISRMLALLALLLFFLAWGFTRRHFLFAQRCLTFAIIVGTMLAAGSVSHPATGVSATAMIGLPIVLTLSVVWLWFSRAWGSQIELPGIGVVSALVFGVISLLRWDGMDGRQRPELSWRWTPNPEERFLQEEAQRAASGVSTQPILRETAADWTSFRGGQRNGIVRGVKLGDWSQSPPREAWRKRIGPAWSSVIAVGDYLFTQEQRGDHEATACYDARTGVEVWVYHPDDSVRFQDSLSGTGPRATPVFHENRIYAYGAKGRLDCLDAVTGSSRWSQALFALTGAAVPQWGSATSPVIVDDLVVVFTGGQQENSLLAFDRLSGELRWKSAGGSISYSTPQEITVAGIRQIVMHDETGLSGYRIKDGKRLWHHASPYAGSFQPMLQPHQIADDRLLLNWDAGLLCLQVHSAGETWQIEELWTSNRFKPSFNEFVIHRDSIYGLDDGILCCLDLASQERKWKRGRYGFGQLLLLPELNELLVLSEQGELIRVAADPNEFREIGRIKAIDGKTWNHPLLAHGRLVVRNSEEIACFLVEQTEQAATPEQRTLD